MAGYNVESFGGSWCITGQGSPLNAVVSVASSRPELGTRVFWEEKKASDYSASSYFKVDANGGAEQYAAWNFVRACSYSLSSASFKIECGALTWSAARGTCDLVGDSTGTPPLATSGGYADNSGDYAVPGATTDYTGGYAVPGATAAGSGGYADYTGDYAVPGATTDYTGDYAVPGATMTGSGGYADYTGGYAVPGVTTDYTGDYAVPGATAAGSGGYANYAGDYAVPGATTDYTGDYAVPGDGTGDTVVPGAMSDGIRSLFCS